MSEPSLTEFLLARLAEDEQEARDKGADAMVGWRWKHAPENVYQELQSVVLANSRRVLADLESKRRIVEHVGWVGELDPHDRTTGAEALLYAILSALALPYADHPDYREEWKP